jgi:hypothetical protein
MLREWINMDKENKNELSSKKKSDKTESLGKKETKNSMHSMNKSTGDSGTSKEMTGGVSDSLHSTIESLNKMYHRVEEPLHNVVKKVGDNLTMEHLDELINSRILRGFVVLTGVTLLGVGLLRLFNTPKMEKK